ncbi:MAG: hypothetical protein KJ000_35965 [Pirellulaceae bacterium]|nr:hypothetical protein [Pirellulaceae bacterium]
MKPLVTLRHYDWGVVPPLSGRLGKLRRRRQQPFHGALERRCRANTATAITGPDHDGTPTVTALEYDLAGRLKATVDPLGRRTAFGYDAAGQMTSLTRPDPAGDGSQGGPVTGWAFDALGRVVSQTDPLGNVTALAYEDYGRRIVTTHPDPDGGGPLDSPETVAQYDAAGNLIAATDALDRVTAYAYDQLGRLVRVTHPDPDDPSQPGSETEYQYDKAGNLRFVIDVLGNVTELVYDHRDRLVEMVLPDPDGLGSPQWTYTYDAAGQRLTETDPLVRTTSYLYDALGRVVEYTLPDPDGPGPLAAPVYSYAYDLAGNLLSVTDPLNHTTSYTYDDFDRVLTVTDALSGVTGFAYDARGQLLERTDPLGRTTAWSYDQLGRTVAVTDPLNQTTAFAYDAVGNLLSVTDPLNHTTSYAYDNLYRRTAVTDPLSGATTFAYDAAGQLLEHTDPLSRTTAWAYDGLGRVTSVTDPLSQVTGYTYDAAGNLLSVTDPLNRTTSYSYDDLYRRTAIIDPLAGMTTFSFDLAGNLTGLTDPVDNTTAWDYDGLNRVVAETNELNDARTFTYDAANNLLTRTDRNGRVIEYAYDALHRRVEEQWLDDQQTVIRTLSFSYDAASQLTAAADPAASYDYQYDALGRRTSVTHDIAGLGFPVVLASAYDAASNRTSLSATIDTTADFVNQYTYDGLHRMTRIEQTGVTGGNAVAEKRIDLTYDAASQYQTITRYADLAATKLVATSDYTLDAAGRLTVLSHAQGATPLAGYSWTYDAGNRITEFTSLLDGTADYTYDDTDQLTGADYTAGAGLPPAPPDETYGYDANGNRTMTGYATGDNNLVLSDGTYDYEYDAEGNRTRRTYIASGEVTDYDWDHRNRLTRVTVKASDQGPVTKDILYDYDVFNRLVGKSVAYDTDPADPEDVTYFVYDGERWERGNAGDHLALVFDGNGDLTNRYVYGPAVDQILADEQLDSLTTPGEVLWPLTDNLGTVRDLAAFDDATGDTTVVNHRTYTAFGQILSETDPTIEHRFAYTARHWDDDAQLYHYRARWYDPALGRFLSEDPIGFEAGDGNLQRYVGNSVTNVMDPSGLEPRRAVTPLQQYWAARNAELDESLWNLANPLKGSFLPRYLIGSMYHAFAAAPGSVQEGFAEGQARVNERHSSADDTVANRASHAFQTGTLYAGEAIAHGGVRLGQVGMAGYAAAHGGPVGPALMQCKTVQALGVIGTGTGAVVTTRNIVVDLSQGNAPSPGDLVDLGIFGCTSFSSWRQLTTALSRRIPHQLEDQLGRGGSYVMTEEQYLLYAKGKLKLGRSDGQFMTSASEMNRVIHETGGDPVQIAQRLGLQNITPDTALIRMDVTDPLKFNPRMPSASMSGANPLFRPGGKTIGGVPEVVTDPLPAQQVWATPIIPKR